MPPEPSRRAVLASAGALALGSGCTALESAFAPGDSAPHPTHSLPTLSGDHVSVSQRVQFEDAGAYGWRIEGSFTRAVSLSASVTRGRPVTVYLTEARLEEARVPESSVASFDAPGAVDGVELTGGSGTVVLDASGPSTVSVTLDAESI